MAYTATMTRSCKPRSGIALGGIGAGWFELRQDGQTYDWNIFNNRPLGTGPQFPLDTSSMLFFIVRYQEQGKTPKMRLLQIENKYGAAGIRDHEMYYIVPWLAGVDKIEYSGTFPFINMRFTDKDMPFVVELETFSPFIPNDAKNSSLPAAIFNFKITSKTKNPVEVMILSSMRNAVDFDVADRTYNNKIVEGKGYKSIEMTCDGVDKKHFSHGTMGVTSLAASSSYYLGWEHHHPYYELLIRNSKLANINDTDGRNSLDKKTNKKRAMDYCFSSIGYTKKLDGKDSSFDHSFIVSWNFPNNYGRVIGGSEGDNEKSGAHIEGHYYSNFFSTSTEVAEYVGKNLAKITKETKAFKDAFYDSSAESWLLDQINSNLNTFFTSSWFTKEGHFGIIEGLNSKQSFAGLNTTDVAMYGSVSYGSLFPELTKDAYQQFARFQADNGKVYHSIGKNFKDIDKGEWESPRLDMPAQFAFMTLRTFFWSNDRKYLESVWPSVKKALDYVLRERDMNKDMLPDMEGVMCSYDNFPMFGVAPYVAGQFVAAVQSAVAAARVLGDNDAAIKYEKVLENGSKVLEEKAWNGKYYRLWNDEGGKKGGKDEGCLTDQIIGQWGAHQSGLGYFLDPSHVKTALKNILAMNYKSEYGLRNCQWPGDGFLHDVDKDTWIDQANTVWTGVELGFVSLLLFEGMYKEAMMVAKNVDDRYRDWGLYWDHQEFGGRYFRPMSAWGIVNGLLGFAINAGTFTFAPKIPKKDCKLFFTFDQGYGHYSRISKAKKEEITLAPVRGTLKVHQLILETGIKTPSGIEVNAAGKKLPASNYSIATANGMLHIKFVKEHSVAEGKAIKVSIS